MDNFIVLLSTLVELFFQEGTAPEMEKEFLSCLDQDSYIFMKILLALYLKMPPDTIQNLMQSLEEAGRNAMPFF